MPAAAEIPMQVRSCFDVMLCFELAASAGDEVLKVLSC